jgi:phosphoenolpyruvate carboxylase
VALPGWYGFGSAVEAFLGVKAGERKARSNSCAHAQALAVLPHPLSNLDMVLAKTDLGMAARYVDLVEDRKTRQTHLQRDPRRMDAHR